MEGLNLHQFIIRLLIIFEAPCYFILLRITRIFYGIFSTLNASFRGILLVIGLFLVEFTHLG
jgi:hypothetical protein